MKFLFQKDRLPALLAIGLLVASFIGVGITFPAHGAGATPVVAHTAFASWSTGSTFTITLTITNIGDEIVVTGDALGTTAGTNPVISSVKSTKAGNPTLLDKNFALIQSVQTTCVSSAGFCATGNRYGVESLWTAIANATGSATITITVSATSNLSADGVAYDIEFTNNSPSSSTTSACNSVAAQSCGTPISGGLTSGANDVLIMGVSGFNLTVVSASGGCTVIITANGFGGSYLAGAATCGVNVTAASGLGYAVVAVTFSASVVTSTTVINTNCLGACSSGANATSTYFSTAIPALFVFYASQNTASQGQIDNFTMKVKAVHINAQTGNLLIGIYMPATPTTAPSGGNQYSLVKSMTYPISNGTTDFFIHENPQANICASCYYAAGIMSTTTASRGSGATGAGVSFYETSGATSQQFTFNPGGVTLPSTFFSSTVQRPNFFMYVHESYTVATVTTTSTLTQSGLVTSTSTVTTTSTNTINQLDMSKAGFWFIPLLFLLAPMALLIVVKRVADGR